MAYPFVQDNFDVIATNGNNPWVDGITYNAYWRNDSGPSTPLLLKIYFLNPGDLNAAAAPQTIQQKSSRWVSTLPWPASQRQAYLEGFAAWANVIPLQIKVVEAIDQADIIYARVDFPNHGVVPLGTVLGSHQGLANTPEGSQRPLISDINGWYFGDDIPSGRGSSFLETVIHEVGHGIGLAHAHDDGLGTVRSGIFPGLNEGDSFSAYGGFGLYAMNQNVFTIMSYNRGYTGDQANPLRRLKKDDAVGNVATPMALDVMAAQLKYGVNLTTNRGDNVYQLPASQEQAYWQCLWDGSGIDAIDARAATDTTTIDLRPAPMNAQRPEDGQLVEQYRWSRKPEWATILNFMVNSVTKPGSILGSSYLLGQNLEAVLIKADQDGLFVQAVGQSLDSIAADLDGFIDRYASAKNLDVASAIDELADILFDSYILTAKALLRDSNSFTDDYYEDLAKQSEILSESASHIGGYISSVRGVQGGFTIAAGVTIEKALGSDYDDTITGNPAANKLLGRSGVDTIRGGEEDDVIKGGNGEDHLHSDLGHDTAHGGSGADHFIIHRQTSTSVFEVMDFSKTQGDKLSFRGFDGVPIEAVREGSQTRYYALPQQAEDFSKIRSITFTSEPSSGANLIAIIHTI